MVFPRRVYGIGKVFQDAVPGADAWSGDVLEATIIQGRTKEAVKSRREGKK